MRILALLLGCVFSSQAFAQRQNLDDSIVFGLLGKRQDEVIAELRGADLNCISNQSLSLNECPSIQAFNRPSKRHVGFTLFFKDGLLKKVRRLVAQNLQGNELFEFISKLDQLLAVTPGVTYDVTFEEQHAPDGSTLHRTLYRSNERVIEVTYAFNLRSDNRKPMKSFVQLDELRWTTLP